MNVFVLLFFLYIRVYINKSQKLMSLKSFNVTNNQYKSTGKLYTVVWRIF